MKLRLILPLLLFTFSIVLLRATDHDSVTQMQQNMLYNNRRLDNQDIRMDKQDERMGKIEQQIQTLENEFTSIRSIGLAVIAIGGFQLILQFLGLVVKPKKNNNTDYNP